MIILSSGRTERGRVALVELVLHMAAERLKQEPVAAVLEHNYMEPMNHLASLDYLYKEHNRLAHQEQWDRAVTKHKK